MIDLDQGSVVAERRTGDGRFALFVSLDRPVGWPLPWRGVVFNDAGHYVRSTVRLWVLDAASLADARGMDERVRQDGRATALLDEVGGWTPAETERRAA